MASVETVKSGCFSSRRDSCPLTPISNRHALIRRRKWSISFLANHNHVLRDEFIALNVLLKLLGLVSSGGSAKILIATGAVRVDGQPETRIRRKLRPGNVVMLGDDTIRIIGRESAES